MGSSPRPWFLIGAAALIAAHLLLAGAASRRIGYTFDEGVGIAGGFAILTRGEMVINYEHPPLLKTLAALPLLGFHPGIDPSDPDYAAGKQWNYVPRFLFGSGVDPDAILRRVRIAPLLTSGLLALTVLLLSRRLWGDGGALLSLAFYAFDPSFLGHAPLVQFDVALSLVLLSGCWAFHRSLGGGLGWSALAGAILGMGLATKFTTAGLPILWLALLVASRPPIDGELVRKLLVTGAAAGLALALCYGFVLLPDFWRGFQWQLHHAAEGHRTYLLGETTDAARRLYFPIALLLKTPLETMAASILAAAVFLPLWRRPQVRLCLIGAAGFFGLMLLSSINIGHRYLLPCYPFLFVLLGCVASGKTRWGKLGPALGIGLAVLLGARAFVTFPNYIGSTNALAGSRPELFIADSNLDWGQDLPALKAWQEATGNTRIHLAYMGMDSPKHRGIQSLPMPCGKEPGLYVVSINIAVGAYPRNNRCYRWLADETPVDRIGTSLLVYAVSGG